MMKIVATLIILSLCSSVAFGFASAPVSSTNGATAFSSSWLNSTATKVYTISNSTDAANWDSSSTTTVAGGVEAAMVYFGPGMTNDTSYVYGVETSGNTVSKIIKRTINNTIVGWQNDTVEASVVATDSAITTTIIATSGSFMPAVGPGYLALLTTGADSGSNNQVYVTLLSGTSPTTTKVTSVSDVVAGASLTAGQYCTTTTMGLGNIWYDIGSGAFFYTYWKRVVTQVVAATATGGTGTCGGSTGATTVNTIGLGGIYVNSTVYWTTPLSIATVTSANAVATVLGGGDNWLNASNIYVVYQDSTVTSGSTTGITYVSKTTKATTTTAGSFSSLVGNSMTSTSGNAAYVYSQFTPVAVWASNFTFGITVSNYTQAGATPTKTYSFTNYLNSSMTSQDSGLSSSSATGFGAFWGWQLNTGYTLVGVYETATSYAYVAGTWYGNGTVNQTATTIATIVSPVSFYEDVNGTNWIGWTDYDTANGYTYAGYLAKFQGQLNVPSSGANVLSALSAFALFLAAIFVF